MFWTWIIYGTSIYNRKVLFVCLSRKMSTSSWESPVTTWTPHNHPVQLQVSFDGSRLVFHGSISVFIGFQGFRLVSRWFHVFSRFLVGFHGFSSWFHGFSWFLVGFNGFSRFPGGFSLSLMVPGWLNPSWAPQARSETLRSPKRYSR